MNAEEKEPKLVRAPKSKDPRFRTYVVSDRDGSVYTLESRALVQYPQLPSSDEGVVWENEGADVAWDCIEEQAVPYLRQVEALLKEAMA